MFYTDTHIHLQDYRPEEVKNVVNNAIKNNVSAFINPSAHPSDWHQIEELLAQYPQVIPAFGIHPWNINAAPRNWPLELEKLLQKYPQAAIGECGIDRLKNPDISSQIIVLQTQIALAKKYQRPLILHMVKAFDAARGLFPSLPPHTVFHSYTGPIDWGNELAQRGFFIGCNQALLRKKNAAEIIAEIALPNLLLETDGPYQSIVPQQPSLPQNLPQLAQEIANIKQISLAQLQKILYKNTQNFLGVQ